MKLFTVMIAAALAGSFGIAAAADTQPATTGKAAEEAPKVDPEGAILFDKYCASCHPKVDPPRPGEQPKAEDMRELPPDQMKADAPPITMMAAAYRTSAGNDKTRYIGLLTTFLKTPTAETALDQRAVAQFGLKKPISEKYPQITDVELTTIVNWMWDHYALTGPAQSTAQPQVPAAQGQTAQPATAPQAPAATPQQPQAGFDTMAGQGTGKFNGQSATIEFKFTDAGEPGTNDTTTIVIKKGSTVVLTVSGKITGGNHQAHKN